VPFTALETQVNKGHDVETHVKEVLVFRGKKVTRGQEAWFYMRAFGASYNSNWVADPLEAKDFTAAHPTEIVKALEGLAKNTDSYDAVELVKMKITTECSPVNINHGDILEERRRQALAKLNPMEIEALGVEKLASYNKLKFHGRPD
jgi:hypothetical protein